MQWGYSNNLKYSSKTFIYLIRKEGHVQNDNEERGVGVGIQIPQLHKEKRGQKKKAADQDLPEVIRPIIIISFKFHLQNTTHTHTKHQIIFKLLLPEPPKIIRQRKILKVVIKSFIKGCLGDSVG